MDISKNALLGAIGILIFIVGIAAFNLPTPVVNVAPVVERTVERQLAGPSGFNFLNPLISFNEVEKAPTRMQMTSATNTPIAFRPGSVFNATSTLTKAMCYYNAASTTLSLWTFAKSGSAYTTTTQPASTGIRLGEQKIVAGGAKAQFVATTSVSTTFNPDLVFGPNDYFVVGVQGGTAGSTFSFTNRDVCDLEFTKF